MFASLDKGNSIPAIPGEVTDAADQGRCHFTQTVEHTVPMLIIVELALSPRTDETRSRVEHRTAHISHPSN